VTLTELDDKLTGRLRRTILRVIQRDGPITRTQLTVQVRPHSEHWDLVLDDLIDRGLIVREAVLRGNNRSAVSYHLQEMAAPDFWPDFNDLTPEEVTDWIESLDDSSPAKQASA